MKYIKNYFLTPLLVVTLFTSCIKGDNNGSVTFSQTYKAELNGVNAVPTNSSSSTAVLSGVYTSNTQKLNFTVTYKGISPTSWAIHSGVAGVAGPVEFTLGAISPSPYNGSITLTPAQLSNLNTGIYYINIVSAGFPDGEIRGQITK